MVIILVTGRADFIGSHTCMNLLELSYKIVNLDSYLNSSKKFFKEINKICRSKGINQNLINNFEGDISVIKSIEEIFRKSKEIKLFNSGIYSFCRTQISKIIRSLF